MFSNQYFCIHYEYRFEKKWRVWHFGELMHVLYFLFKKVMVFVYYFRQCLKKFNIYTFFMLNWYSLFIFKFYFKVSVFILFYLYIKGVLYAFFYTHILWSIMFTIYNISKPALFISEIADFFGYLDYCDYVFKFIRVLAHYIQIWIYLRLEMHRYIKFYFIFSTQLFFTLFYLAYMLHTTYLVHWCIWYFSIINFIVIHVEDLLCFNTIAYSVSFFCVKERFKRLLFMWRFLFYFTSINFFDLNVRRKVFKNDLLKV